MTQKQYMESMLDSYNRIVQDNEQDFRRYSYINDSCDDRINEFCREVKNLGLSFSNCYHANGIGNNNEYTIYQESTDDEGFRIKREVAKLNYCYGIYGGCSIWLTDLANNKCYKVGKAS